MKQSIPGTLKRISAAEKNLYIELDIYSKEVCTRAIALTLTPDEAMPPGLYGSPWEKVTYYADESSISNTSLSPLEHMYKEWGMNKDVTNERN